MNLQKLKNLYAELIEIRNQYEKLDLSVKEEKRKIKKQMADLKKALENQLNEVEKKALEQRIKLCEQSDIIYDKLNSLLKKADKYGRYDILDLGEILKDLATKITGKQFNFMIKERKDMFNFKGYAVYYNRQEAYLSGEGPYCEAFVFAESKIPDGDSIPLYTSSNGIIDLRGGTYSYFGNSDPVMYYRCNGQFAFDILIDRKIREMKIYPFVYDFLNYVSLYRLNNDLSEIDKTKLELLEEKFLIEFGDKYEKYKEIKCESIEYHEHIMPRLTPQKRKKRF